MEQGPVTLEIKCAVINSKSYYVKGWLPYCFQCHGAVTITESILLLLDSLSVHFTSISIR